MDALYLPEPGVAAGVRPHFVTRAAHGMMWDNPEGFVAAVKAALTYRGEGDT